MSEICSRATGILLNGIADLYGHVCYDLAYLEVLERLETKVGEVPPLTLAQCSKQSAAFRGFHWSMPYVIYGENQVTPLQSLFVIKKLLQLISALLASKETWCKDRKEKSCCIQGTIDSLAPIVAPPNVRPIMENKKRLARLGLDLIAEDTDKRRYPAFVVTVVKVCITHKADGFWLALAYYDLALRLRPRYLATRICLTCMQLGCRSHNCLSVW